MYPPICSAMYSARMCWQGVMYSSSLQLVQPSPGCTGWAITRRGTMLHIAARHELLLDYICTCSSLVIIINADWLIKRHTEDCMAVLSFPIITLTTGICTMLVTILINRILHPHHHSAGLRQPRSCGCWWLHYEMQLGTGGSTHTCQLPQCYTGARRPKPCFE